MSKPSKISYFFITFIFFTIIDLYLSNYILKFGYKLPSNPVFDFIFIQNDGAAFNILQNCRSFLIVFSAAAIFGIFVYVIKNISRLKLIAVFFASLLSAGIFCNLLERIFFGYVRDFIKINFFNFPIFNISDIFINLSVFAIIIIIIKNNYFKKL